MALPECSDYNIIAIRHAFEISAFVTAFHYTSKPYFEPYYEKFNFSQIFLVLKGEGKYTTESGSFDISPGTMFYRPAGHESIYEWSSEAADFALISFVCDSEVMNTFCGEPIPLCEEEINLLLDLIETSERVCEPIKENEKYQGMRLKINTPDVVLGFISASLERFLSMVYCRLKKISPLVDESRKAANFIDESILIQDIKNFLADNVSKKLTMDAICGYFGIGQTALMKKFRKETGLGVMEYFTNLKITKAKELISATALSFSEISDALAFSSPNYFSRVFKEKIGLTPTQYSRHVSKRSIILKVKK